MFYIYIYICFLSLSKACTCLGRCRYYKCSSSQFFGSERCRHVLRRPRICSLTGWQDNLASRRRRFLWCKSLGAHVSQKG